MTAHNHRRSFAFDCGPNWICARDASGVRPLSAAANLHSRIIAMTSSIASVEGEPSTRMDQNGEDPMAQRYDTAFKLTLQHVDVTMRELVGSAVTNWMNIEFPQIQAPRADLLGETT